MNTNRWFELEVVPAQRPEPGSSGSGPVFRAIVWERVNKVGGPFSILAVAEHEDLDVVNDWLRDCHPNVGRCFPEAV